MELVYSVKAGQSCLAWLENYKLKKVLMGSEDEGLLPTQLIQSFLYESKQIIEQVHSVHVIESIRSYRDEESSGFFDMIRKVTTDFKQDFSTRHRLKEKWLNTYGFEPHFHFYGEDEGRNLYALTLGNKEAFWGVHVHSTSERLGLTFTRYHEGYVVSSFDLDEGLDLLLWLKNLAVFCGLDGPTGVAHFLNLASLGEDRFYERMKADWLEETHEGLFEMNMDYFLSHPVVGDSFATLSKWLGSRPRMKDDPVTIREMDLATSAVKLFRFLLEKLLHRMEFLSYSNQVMVTGQTEEVSFMAQQLLQVYPSLKVQEIKEKECFLEVLGVAFKRQLLNAAQPSPRLGPVSIRML